MRFVDRGDDLASMAGHEWKPAVGDLVLATYTDEDKQKKKSPGAITQLISNVEVRVKLAPGVYVKVDVDDLQKLNPR